MSSLNYLSRLIRSFCRAGLTLSLAGLSAASLNAQKTTGGIEGIIVDSSGAVVAHARVTATDESTGEKQDTISDQTGLYRFLDLHPDPYQVRVEAQGFKQVLVAHVVVLIAHVTPLGATLPLGSASEQVNVSAGAATDLDTVSTESGEVITAKQIEELPIVGRSAMDLAQLAPGVQLRDGNDIDPTKNNFTIAAFQGRSGRETQVQLDGLSIQDHIVGGPVQNTGIDSVQEFQVAQSTLNPAQSVASGGAVNILTRSGGNQVHGSAFEFFRDSRLGAKIGPVSSPYDRNQIGGRLGGAFIPNRLFYFGNYELTDSRDSFYIQSQFSSLNHFYSKPFREHFVIGRIDGVISDKWKVFGRYSYSPNHGVVGYPTLGGTSLNSVTNKAQAIVIGGGLNYAGSHITHSFSYGFNSYSDTLTPNPLTPSPVDEQGRKYLLVIDSGSTLAYGPNALASQFEKQHNHEWKYDGDLQHGKHTLAFGVDLTRWQLGTDYPLHSAGPEMDSVSSAVTASLSNPAEFPLLTIVMGNGLGYYSVPGALGFQHGAFSQWRPAAYVHDVWNVSHQVTINAGVRYLFMSGQFDAGLKRPAVLDTFKSGYGGYRHNPKTDFAPQIGAAWDLGGHGKTVIRSAVGLYYEELSFDGFYGDSPNFIPAGLSVQSQTITSGAPLIDPRSGSPFAANDPLAAQYGFSGGTSKEALAPLFSGSIAQAAKQVGDLNQLYVAASALNTSSASSFDINGAIFNPAWTPGVKSPRVLQYNFAVQQQLRKGLVFTGEYVFVHGYEFPMAIDENHIGSASTNAFDAAAAAAAISATNTQLGCPPTSAGIDCAIANGATIKSYGATGLGAGSVATGSAFRGVNPSFGTMNYYEHKGMNTYNGLNLRLDGVFGRPSLESFRWITGNTLTFAYTLSRNVGNVRTAGTGAADIAATPGAWDTVHPNQFVGPDGLDRTSILNFATVTNVKGGFLLSQITHWYTPLSNNPLLPVASGGCSGGSDEIFCTDVTGDGTINDLLPTGGPGAFGRSIKGAKGLNKVIATYNSQYAGHLTPAGDLLVSQGLMTEVQLTALGGTMPILTPAPTNQVGLDLLLLTDVRAEWSHKLISERLTIQPSWDIFNLFNRSSFDAPGNLLNGTLSGTVGSINGTTANQRTNIRQRGSGTFEQGARRQMQAGLRLTF